MQVTNSFDGNVLLPYAILGLVLCIGYVVWRKTRKSPDEEPDLIPADQDDESKALEDALKAEIAAIKGQPVESDAEDDLILDLPKDERERLAALKAQVGQSPPDNDAQDPER